VSRATENLNRWALRLRLAAYAFGLGAMGLMVYARSLDELTARAVWTRHSTLCLGLMIACFVGYYVMTLVRIKRP
jgi:hypothetical protein